MPSSGLRRLFPPQKVSVFSPVLNDPAVLSMANFRIYSMKEEMGGVDWEQRAGAMGQRGTTHPRIAHGQRYPIPFLGLE